MDSKTKAKCQKLMNEMYEKFLIDNKDEIEKCDTDIMMWGNCYYTVHPDTAKLQRIEFSEVQNPESWDKHDIAQSHLETNEYMKDRDNGK